VDYDKNKLIYFSSPHKGLERTLALFPKLRAHGFTLSIANPGYLPDAAINMDGVTVLGALPHAEVMKELQSSLCVLHLNDVFPETFGLVHAEANALGVPVLTSIKGANREILMNHEQLVDVRDDEAVIRKLLGWRIQRPVVKGRDEFRLSNVLTEWEKLFHGSK
jgi:glycosyltransferase involved in cell wall biosynthesis